MENMHTKVLWLYLELEEIAIIIVSIEIPYNYGIIINTV